MMTPTRVEELSSLNRMIYYRTRTSGRAITSLGVTAGIGVVLAVVTGGAMPLWALCVLGTYGIGTVMLNWIGHHVDAKRARNRDDSRLEKLLEKNPALRQDTTRAFRGLAVAGFVSGVRHGFRGGLLSPLAVGSMAWLMLLSPWINKATTGYYLGFDLARRLKKPATSPAPAPAATQDPPPPVKLSPAGLKAAFPAEKAANDTAQPVARRKIRRKTTIHPR